MFLGVCVFLSVFVLDNLKSNEQILSVAALSIDSLYVWMYFTEEKNKIKGNTFSLLSG